MGRKSHGEKSSHREQAPKQARGFARGHGAHHKHQPGKGAPRRLGTGRDRTENLQRVKDFLRLQDDQLHDLSNQHRNATGERKLQELEDSRKFGAKLEGPLARGVVLEVRKGNFLTRVTNIDEHTAQAAGPMPFQIGTVLRTIVRGTLQQFDLGLSSLVAPGDEISMIVPPQAAAGELHQTELHGVLTDVTERRNEFRRVHPSGRAIQTLAANVDRVMIVASTGEPEFRPGFVDRVLVCAAASNLAASLVVNKMDLGIDDDTEELLAVYRSLGYPVFKISARDPNFGDFAALKAHLIGQRTVLTGHSGVGKSSLLLALDPQLPEDIVRTGEVSTQTRKGTHTTTHARLFEIHSGEQRAEVIDTPGVREFTPADTDRRNLWGWFPEMAKLQGQCGFPDCTHTVEKGCAVLAAVERGEIHPRRHQSYEKIYHTLPQ